jgi:hypothetical protein
MGLAGAEFASSRIPERPKKSRVCQEELGRPQSVDKSFKEKT